MGRENSRDHKGGAADRDVLSWSELLLGQNMRIRPMPRLWVAEDTQ